MNKRPYSPQHTDYCFTINLSTTLSPTDTSDAISEIRGKESAIFQTLWADLTQHALYAVAALELSETQRLHWQGFVVLSRKRTVGSATQLLGGHCHVAARKGTRFQAASYCLKTRGEPTTDSAVRPSGVTGGTQQLSLYPGHQFGLGCIIFEHGQRPLPDAVPSGNGEANAKRQRLARLGAVAREQSGNLGHGVSTLFEHPDVGVTALEFPFLAQLLCTTYSRPSAPPKLGRLRKIVVLRGTAGSGKSAGAQFALPTAYSKDKHKHWPGYNGVAPVIIDDLSPGHQLDPGEFKRLFQADTQPTPVSVPYQQDRQVLVNPPCIILTTNWPWQELFPPSRGSTLDEGIRRRFLEAVRVTLHHSTYIPPSERKHFFPKLWQLALRTYCNT